MRRAGIVLSAVIAAGLAAIAIFGLWQAGTGIQRRVVDVDGVPVELFEPAGGAANQFPAVVVAHGFSGNRQLMYGFGNTLARNGYVAALIDFAGHGSSLDRLPEGSGEAGIRTLASNIGTALDYVRQLPNVDPARVAILGHSMGAGVVARYGAEHPEVPATIAVSLGGLGNPLPAQADAPRNFLILVGANEFAGFADGSLAGLRAAYPDGVAGTTYGDFGPGTARRLVVVPGVEHISILFSPDTYREMVEWLDDAVRGEPSRDGAALALDSRIGWILLLYLAAAIGFYPLATVALARGAGARRAPVDGTPRVVPGWVAILLSAAGALLAPLLMLVVPYAWMPLSVGNYVGVYFLLYGAVLIAAMAALKRLGPQGWGEARRLTLPVAVLSAYALVTFGLVAHLAWTSFALAGARLWMAVVLFFEVLVYFWADEVLVWRTSAPARAGLYALTKVFLLASLVGAIFVLRAPFFLLLLIPVMLLLFVWHGLYSHWLFRLTGRAWPAAALNAVVFAWMIAATFAVVG